MVIGNGSGAGKSRVDVNVTPLIDVLLVLLIIFMVTAPVPQHGLDAQVPQPSTGSNHQDEVTVVVSVQKESNGQVNYKINQQGLNLPDLAGRLKAIISIRANKEVFIEGDPGLDFSTIAQVLDIAKVAGAEHVGLITRKSAI